MKTQELLNYLNEIIILLNDNGSNQASDFFLLKYKNIKNSNNSLDNIKELSRCRAMAQYADFSFEEESILDKIADCAIDICRSHEI